MNRARVFGLSFVVAATVAFAPAKAEESTRATLSTATNSPRAVFELFTSQGCSSCPPADNLLTNYAHDDNSVVALTYPVTIWDHLGWRDTLARPENTQRQRAYAFVRGDKKLYTPQVVINGVSHSIGSDKGDIEKKGLVQNRGQALKVPMSVETRDGTVDVSISRWPGQDEPPRARVYLVSYAKQSSVPIGSGENAGKTTTYSNVVQSMQEVAYWNGSKLSLRLFWKPSAAQGGALLLQSVSNAGPGVIYGAVKLP